MQQIMHQSGACAGRGNPRNTCGKIKLFHIIHRFIHKSFPHPLGKGTFILVNINDLDSFRQKDHFFTPCVFHKGQSNLTKIGA